MTPAPDRVLETDRLCFTPLVEEDAVHLERLFRGDWDAIKHTGRMPFPPTAAAFHDWIVRRAGGSHAFLIRLKADQEPIGAIGFGRDRAIAELGYAIGRAYWGKGYASEAVGKMILLAQQLGLAGLRAYSFVDNPASARVLEKAGFTDKGQVLKEYPKRGGMRRVHHFMKMLRA